MVQKPENEKRKLLNGGIGLLTAKGHKKKHTTLFENRSCVPFGAGRKAAFTIPGLAGFFAEVSAANQHRFLQPS